MNIDKIDGKYYKLFECITLSKTPFIAPSKEDITCAYNNFIYL